MALVERLMKLEAPYIPVHDFFAAQSELINSKLTVAQIKNFLNMDAAAAAEYDALIATAPTGSTATALANKALFIEGIHSVFILAEKRYPNYDTPQAVRTRLGI